MKISGNLSAATADREEVRIQIDASVLPHELEAGVRPWPAGLLLVYGKTGFRPAQHGEATAVLNTAVPAGAAIGQVVLFGAVRRDMLKVGVDNPESVNEPDLQALAASKIFTL